MTFYADRCTPSNLKRRNCSPFILQLEFVVEQTWTITHYFVLVWHKEIPVKTFKSVCVKHKDTVRFKAVYLCVEFTMNTVLLDYTSHTYTPAVKMLSGWFSTDKGL